MKLEKNKGKIMNIEYFLKKRSEDDNVDVKEKFYDKDKYYDLIKDTVAFANCLTLQDKYIIFGVSNDFVVKGLNNDMPDISNIQQIISTYVEPSINFNLGTETIDGKMVGFIKIINNTQSKPYMIKKNYQVSNLIKLRIGEIYIRKNATNHIADRGDIVNMFDQKNKIFMELNNVINLNEDKFTHQLNLNIKNSSNKKFSIKKISLKFILEDSEILIQDCVRIQDYGNSNLIIDKDNPIIINETEHLNVSLKYEINKKLTSLINQRKIIKVFIVAFNDQNIISTFEIDKKFYKEFL